MQKFKLIFCFVLILSLVCGCSSTNNKANDQKDSTEVGNEPDKRTRGYFEYVILEDGTVDITGYKGNDADLEIPEKIDGMLVTGIGVSSLWSVNYSLKSVTIPDSVTKVGSYPFLSNPFQLCPFLVNIRVSTDHQYLATINGALFSKKDKRLIYYPSALENDSYAIPQGIQIIGENAFYGCKALTSVYIPDSVISIEDRAFSFCSLLTSVKIPDSVTSIGDGAFSFCSSLTSIDIPDSVKSVGSNPFANCERIKEIKVSPDHPYLSIIHGALFSKKDKQLICYPSAFGGVHYIVPDGMQSIGEYAFDNCNSLTYIKIPDSVTSIKERAFNGCTSLMIINIPDGVIDIGDSAFYGCTSLASIDIPHSVANIGIDTFRGCESLSSINIPDSVTSIGGGAFAVCSSLKSISIPHGLTSIENGLFGWCSSLTAIEIPDGVTKIGDGAFFNCSSLTSIVIPNSVTSIGQQAFDGCDAVTVTVQKDSYAGKYCKENNIKYVFPDSLDWLSK